MGLVTSDMCVSLDGFISGPSALDRGFHRVTQWATEAVSFRERLGLQGGECNRDNEIIEEMFERAGAYVMGRRMFDAGEVPWGDEPPFRGPVFVVTHRARETLTRDGGTSFTFVTEGVAHAVELARAAAGERNVAVSGGADTVQQVVKAGLLDELQLHVVPVLLGDGMRLFERIGDDHVELASTRVVESPTVTHLRFRVVR